MRLTAARRAALVLVTVLAGRIPMAHGGLVFEPGDVTCPGLTSPGLGYTVIAEFGVRLGTDGRFESTNSACLGAAIRAFHADRLLAGQSITWDDAITGLAEPQAQPIKPNPKHVVLYRDLRRRYAAFEAEALATRTLSSE